MINCSQDISQFKYLENPENILQNFLFQNSVQLINRCHLYIFFLLLNLVNHLS